MVIGPKRPVLQCLDRTPPESKFECELGLRGGKSLGLLLEEGKGGCLRCTECSGAEIKWAWKLNTFKVLYLIVNFVRCR